MGLINHLITVLVVLVIAAILIFFCYAVILVYWNNRHDPASSEQVVKVTTPSSSTVIPILAPTFSPPPTWTPRPTKVPIDGEIRYRGPALLVSQTGSEVVAENVFGSPVAIRISWDDADPWGMGHCPGFPEDCIIDDWVEPGAYLRAQFKYHASAQLWAWSTHGGLVDLCSFNIRR